MKRPFEPCQHLGERPAWVSDPRQTCRHVQLGRQVVGVLVPGRPALAPRHWGRLPGVGTSLEPSDGQSPAAPGRESESSPQPILIVRDELLLGLPAYSWLSEGDGVAGELCEREPSACRRISSDEGCPNFTTEPRRQIGESSGGT